MESEKREYKERKPLDKQIFYFNDKGQLVVESNRGIWVDGEKFVKMYGDFTCNAKTIGVIIEKFKGIKVDVEISTKSEENFLNVYTERLNEISKLTEENTQQMIEIEHAKNETQSLIKKIVAFNRLPWWKRMFKKIEVK